MSMVKLAIEFDSGYTNIYMKGSGLVLSEPTVAAVDDSGNGQVKAVGIEAKKLIGKTSKNTKIVFPIFEGEIVNENVAIEILKNFLQKIEANSSVFGVYALFSISCGMEADVIEKYKKVAKKAGITRVDFIENPILSALGQQISLNESSPCFVIDIAGGTTNIGAVTIDGVIAGISVSFGGNKISTDIIDYISEKYGMQIGLLTAEKIKKEIGSLDQMDSLSMVVNGRDMNTGTPRAVSIRAMDIFNATKKYFDKVIELSNSMLKKLSPEVLAEIKHSGVYISGADSQIFGLKEYFEKRLEMNVNVSKHGVYTVALGAGMILGNNDVLKRIALKID